MALQVQFEDGLELAFDRDLPEVMNEPEGELLDDKIVAKTSPSRFSKTLRWWTFVLAIAALVILAARAGILSRKLKVTH